MAIINGTSKADKLKGTAQTDLIFGGNGDDIIDGGAGIDFLFGGNGNDVITGGAGNDVIEGGSGQDTLVLGGNRADYSFQPGLFGTATARDLRPGAPDGLDVLIDMERVQFKDGIFGLRELLSGNAAPVARNDALTLSETAGKTEITSILLANDSDSDGDALVVSSVQAESAKGAAVSIGPDGKVSYDPGAVFADLDNGETAADSFTYTITDGKGHVSTATATVTITGVTQNVAPVAGNDALTLSETAGKTEITSILLANDSDSDGDALVVGSVQAVSAQGAAVSVGPDGKVSYDPGSIFRYLDAGQSATDSFTYTVSDGEGHVSTATVTVTITGVTQGSAAPVAVDDHFELDEDVGLTDVTAVLLSNDSDPHGDSIEIVSVQTVSDMGATVAVNHFGFVTYDAGDLFSYLEDGETATDSFTYEIVDAEGFSSWATATVTINGVTPETEEPGPDTFFTINEDETEELLADIVDRFDFAVVGVDVTGTLGTVRFDPAQGVLSFAADHDSSDVLNWDAHEDTSFTVIGADGQRKVVGIRIAGNNDDIVAVDDEVAIGEGQSTGNLWDAMIANEIDPDGSAVSRQILSVGTAGTLGVVSFDPDDNVVTYSAAGIDLAPGEVLVDSFTYTVRDDHRSVDTATVFVTVTGGSNGAASLTMRSGDSPLPAFAGGAGASHMDDGEFAGFPSMQEMLVTDAVVA